MTHHKNNGFCEKCEEILLKYKNFDYRLYHWFRTLQNDKKIFHVSCAGRGRWLQEKYFNEGRSRAHYGQSAHNYNMAIDLFINLEALIYNKSMFDAMIPRYVSKSIDICGVSLIWYGQSKKFYELPHVEIKDWKKMKKELVE